MNNRHYGKLSKSYISELGESWAVYAFSHKYKRNVNTHVFLENQKKEAILTMQQINR